MEELGITVSTIEDNLVFEKSGKKLELTQSKVRRIMLNSIVSYIDNTINL